MQSSTNSGLFSLPNADSMLQLWNLLSYNAQLSTIASQQQPLSTASSSSCFSQSAPQLQTTSQSLAHQSSQCRVPWTAEEEDRFVLGLKQYGKGRWTDISCVVKSRTPRQVKNHAMTYFHRLASQNKRSASCTASAILMSTISSAVQPQQFQQPQPQSQSQQPQQYVVSVLPSGRTSSFSQAVNAVPSESLEVHPVCRSRSSSCGTTENMSPSDEHDQDSNTVVNMLSSSSSSSPVPCTNINTNSNSNSMPVSVSVLNSSSSNSSLAFSNSIVSKRAKRSSAATVQHAPQIQFAMEELTAMTSACSEEDNACFNASQLCADHFFAPQQFAPEATDAWLCDDAFAYSSSQTNQQQLSFLNLNLNISEVLSEIDVSQF
eukprot:ANDGO_00929.mRNA.1 Transcription factor DIVARICATA